MNTDKDYGGDLCKSHSARSEKEFCRVCPTNLNKKELENVYFMLLENNLDLKTTINSQREKIKILSTKVQRLTTLQKTYLGKEPKECCGSKAVINDQKECILELRRSNQCLSERVRQLNMRLCSAKQFLKRSPFQSTSRCNRCSNKNVSMSVLMTKRSETNLRATADSSQYLVKDIVSSRTTDNVIISHEKGVQFDFCDENKSRNHIDELKKRNEDLQAELSKLKDKHVAEMSQLERDVCDLRAENVRVHSDRVLAEDRVGQLRTQLAEVTARLNGADLRCDELTVELTVEKRKACELETRLRAADMSLRIAAALETHLSNVKVNKDHTSELGDLKADTRDLPTNDTSKFLAVQSPIYRPKAAARTRIPHTIQVDEVFRNSDDSGYTEVNRSQEVDDTKASTYINEVLLEKIADLQNQVNKLRAFKNDYINPHEILNVTGGMNTENIEMDTPLPEKQLNDEIIISESSDSVITEKKIRDTSIPAIQLFNCEKNTNIETKPLTTVQVNKSAEIKRNKIDKQKSELSVDTKVTDGAKNFKEQSTDIGRKSNKLTASRKLSLQTSRDIFKQQNIVKTCSLDENTIIKIGSVKIDNAKTFENGGMVTKNSNLNSSRKSYNDIIVNTEELNSSNTSIKHIKEKAEESYKGYRVRNEETVENAEVTNSTKDQEKKDSESSKGTYTICKDDYDKKIKGKPQNDNKVTELNRNTTCRKDPYTLAVEVKKVLDRAASKAKLVHRQRMESAPGTYVKARRDVSPDSTECEISSMSDLPSERDERSGYSRSPGEERAPAVSDTVTTTTTTDYGSLSEGELPHPPDATYMSEGEKRRSYRTGKSYSVPVSNARNMGATLAAVQQELARCSQLLRSHVHRSLDASGPID